MILSGADGYCIGSGIDSQLVQLISSLAMQIKTLLHVATCKSNAGVGTVKADTDSNAQ